LAGDGRTLASRLGMADADMTARLCCSDLRSLEAPLHVTQLRAHFLELTM
jgi:hypothetical protein